MNTSDSTSYMQLLHRGLVLIRSACQCGDTGRAEAIADALHNLPLILDRPGELSRFSELYLTPLVQQYPDLAELMNYLTRAPDKLASD